MDFVAHKCLDIDLLDDNGAGGVPIVLGLQWLALQGGSKVPPHHAQLAC